MFQILIPMAGLGQRFIEAGYKLPKPLIDVSGKQLIRRVVESIGINGQYIFCVLKEHEEKYEISKLLRSMKPDYKMVIVDKLTQGAVSTCLLAEKYIDPAKSLIIANSDQIVEYNRPLFMGSTLYYHGCILTFPANDPKWSYVLTDDEDKVKVVKEKSVISTKANVGIYGWRNAGDFLWSAKELIIRDIRTNNEFYIAETYNILIQDGCYIKSVNCAEMLGAGTPIDLETTIKIIEYRKKLI